MRLGAAAVAVLGLIVPSTAGAVPFLSADAGEPGGAAVQNCGPLGGSFISTGAPVSSQIVCGDVSGAGSAQAFAAIGNLGAEARAQGGRDYAAFGGAARYSDTVVFSGPGDNPVLVAINLHFGGSINANNLVQAGASARARAFIDGSLVGEIFVSTAGLCTITFSGLSSCAPVYNATLRSGQISVQQDTPILIELDLQTLADAGGGGISASSLFSNTFGFVTDGPLFALPDEFTADSQTSFIANNLFLPPGAPGAPGAVGVPEPSTFTIFSFGLIGLGFKRRRRAT